MNSNFFKRNRQKLIQELGDGTPVVVAAHGHMQMSLDAEYPFEQERNFYYLTGVDEANWVLVIDEADEYLIKPTRSESEQIFNGKADEANITKLSGISQIVSRGEGVERLKKFKKVRSVLTVEESVGSVLVNCAPKLFFKNLGANVEDISKQLYKLRTIKQPEEIEMLKQAIHITGEAFHEAKKHLENFSSEAQLEAVFTEHFIASGYKHAYNPIVASDKNACILHYTANDSQLEGGGLVLVDIGAKASYYAADVTRTWELASVNERQTEVNQAVRKAHDEILKIIEPGLEFEEYQKIVDTIMTGILAEIGLKNDKQHLRRYLPHAPSHGLGLDVHDPLVGYSSLQTGMVITLEPGIYIPEEGIGARHEDDLLITDDGVENLSGHIE